MSGTAKEAERFLDLHRRAAAGDKDALAQLQRGDIPPLPAPAQPHDVGPETATPLD